MLELNGLSAWVVVDNIELPQYGVQHFPEKKQVVCWIPSEAGKEFSVVWWDPLGNVATAGYLRVDGTPCGAKHMYSATQRPRNRVDFVKKSSVATSTTTERPLTFTRLQLTDDDLYLHITTSPYLGDIQLDIFEVRMDGETRFIQPGMPPEEQILHERTKKVAAHRIKLGDEMYCREKKFVAINKVAHLCSFIFRYRPLELLKANGVALGNFNLKSKPPTDGIIDLTEPGDTANVEKPKREFRAKVVVNAGKNDDLERKRSSSPRKHVIDLTEVHEVMERKKVKLEVKTESVKSKAFELKASYKITGSKPVKVEVKPEPLTEQFKAPPHKQQRSRVKVEVAEAKKATTEIQRPSVNFHQKAKATVLKNGPDAVSLEVKVEALVESESSTVKPPREVIDLTL